MIYRSNLKCPDLPTTPSIMRLLIAGGPAAVFGRVISFVVFALKRVLSGGAIAHIEQEGAKGFLPALTNRDAPAAVVLPVSMVGVAASLFHVNPYKMQRFVGVGVGPTGFSHSLFPIAPATSGDSLLYQVGNTFDHGPAITAKGPDHMAITRSEGRGVDGSQAPKLQTGNVNRNNSGRSIPEAGKAVRALLRIMLPFSCPSIIAHPTA